MMAFILVSALCMAVAGWILTSPRGETCRVEDTDKDRHRKRYLESRGWKAAEVQIESAPPKAPKKPADAGVFEKGGKPAPKNVTPTRKEEPKLDPKPPFEVYVEKVDGKSVVKSFSIVPGEEVYFSKSTKGQLVTLCQMAEIEHDPEGIVDDLKKAITDWAQSEGKGLKFIG